jgi:hypothetical protein
MTVESEVNMGKFDILATYTHAKAMLDGESVVEAMQKGMVAAIMDAEAKSRPSITR